MDGGSNFIFLNSPGAIGKTFVLNTIICSIRMKDENVASSALSGIAANLLYTGSTAHKRFNFIFHFDSNFIFNVKQGSDTAVFFKKYCSCYYKRFIC